MANTTIDAMFIPLHELGYDTSPELVGWRPTQNHFDSSEFFRDDMPMLPYFVSDTKLITPKRHEITLEQIEKLKKKYSKFAEPLNIEKE